MKALEAIQQEIANREQEIARLREAADRLRTLEQELVVLRQTVEVLNGRSERTRRVFPFPTEPPRPSMASGIVQVLRESGVALRVADIGTRLKAKGFAPADNHLRSALSHLVKARKLIRPSAGIYGMPGEAGK